MSHLISAKTYSTTTNQLPFQFQSSDNMSTPSTPSTPCTPPAEAYEVDLISDKDKDSVIEFLRTFFFRDEPLNVNIRLLEGEGARCPELESYCEEVMDHGLSLKAVSASGALIGRVFYNEGLCKRKGLFPRSQSINSFKLKHLFDRGVPERDREETRGWAFGRTL